MHQILLQELILYIDGNKSRLKCLSGMIISLITGGSIDPKGLALGISGDAKASSKIHRIYRLLKEFTFDYMKVASLLLSLFGVGNYVVAMDRTNWKFGKTDINILFLVIVIGKISVPIYWHSLSHGGACSKEFMEEFLQKFIDNFGVEKIKYLLADREFMNKEWLNFLIDNHIRFAIPLRTDHQIRLEKGLKTLTIGKIDLSRTKAGIEKAKLDGIKFGRTVGSTNKKTADKIEKIKIFLAAGKSYDWITKELEVSKKTIADIKKSLPSLNLQLASEKSEVYA